jgi:periplasmic protein TonB
MRLLPIIATAASLTAASALAQNAPANLERPTPQATQEAPHSDRRVSASQLPTWLRKLVAHLNKYKHNGDGRPDRNAEVVIRLVLDRAGHIVSAKVEKTSGDAAIDDAALAMMRSADPLPLPRSFGTNEQLTLVVPVRLSVTRRSQ